MSTPRPSESSHPSSGARDAESASVDLDGTTNGSSDFSWIVVGWATAIIVLAIILVFTVDAYFIKQLWVTITALVPAFLVMHHGFYLMLFKRKFTEAARQGASSEAGGKPATDSEPKTHQVHPWHIRQRLKQQALSEAQHEFGFESIGLDYFLPMLLTAVAGLVPAFLFTHPEYVCSMEGAEEAAVATNLIRLPVPVYEAVLLGAIGAYTYVIMMLGERTFLRDITPASAIWSVVQLFLGPVLGGVVAVIWVDESQVNQFSHKVVYFFAGLGPRQLVAIIQESTRRFLSSGQQLPEVKLIPLQTVRGITQRVEDRLYEEGITDGYMLAMANPVRLYRNIPYDLRQIVSWMDECLLRVFADEHMEALQKEGINGAMDLAYYWEMSQQNGMPAPDPTRIAALATRIQVEKEMLEDLIRRVDEDDQVQLIWSLYLATGKEIFRDVNVNEGRPPVRKR